jgi:hypothetical protein
VADRAACALTHFVEIADSLGIYDKSSENSFILEADLSREKSEYLAELLGLYSRQEFVLLFFEAARGDDKMWVIKTAQPWQTVVAKLRESQLTPVTLRIEKDQAEVWFVDMGDKRATDLKTFASDLNGHASVHAGNAELLGDQDRETAVKNWRQQIRTFEQGARPHLSAQLSSKNWRSATAIHTCSKETMSTP